MRKAHQIFGRRRQCCPYRLVEGYPDRELDSHRPYTSHRIYAGFLINPGHFLLEFYTVSAILLLQLLQLRLHRRHSFSRMQLLQRYGEHQQTDDYYQHDNRDTEIMEEDT